MPRKAFALVGVNPAKIDFAKPDYAHFAHLGSEGVRALLERDRSALREFGFDSELVFVDVDVATATVEAERALTSRAWDCVLIGNGVRSLPSNFLLFEALVNAVHEHAPGAKICFNTKPDDSAEAVRRWISP